MATNTADAPAPAKPKAPKKTTPILVLFGSCKTGKLVEGGQLGHAGTPDQWHESCRGTNVNPADLRLIVCSCDCHENHTVCRDCGEIGVEVGQMPTPADARGNPDAYVWTGRCTDRDACRDRRQNKHLANPLSQEIAAARTAGQKAREDDRARRDRAAQQLAATRGPSIADEPNDGTHPRREPTPRPTKQGQPCHCGCGGTTKGGSFVAGHDMRLKSYLYAIARDPKTKKAPPNTHPERERVLATAEIHARGWNETGIPDKIRNQATPKNARPELGIEVAPDLVISQAVKSRYDRGISAPAATPKEK